MCLSKKKKLKNWVDLNNKTKFHMDLCRGPGRVLGTRSSHDPSCVIHYVAQNGTDPCKSWFVLASVQKILVHLIFVFIWTKHICHMRKIDLLASLLISLQFNSTKSFSNHQSAWFFNGRWTHQNLLDEWFKSQNKTMVDFILLHTRNQIRGSWLEF